MPGCRRHELLEYSDRRSTKMPYGTDFDEERFGDHNYGGGDDGDGGQSSSIHRVCRSRTNRVSMFQLG